MNTSKDMSIYGNSKRIRIICKATSKEQVILVELHHQIQHIREPGFKSLNE